MNERSGAVLVRQGKGLKERRVNLSAAARRALREYLTLRPKTPATSVLFVGKTFRALDSRVLQQMLASAAQRAGIEKRVTPHVLRHSYATNFLRTGGDLATLREQLGHANLATTSRYLHPDVEQVQEMVEDL